MKHSHTKTFSTASIALVGSVLLAIGCSSEAPAQQSSEAAQLSAPAIDIGYDKLPGVLAQCAKSAPDRAECEEQVTASVWRSIKGCFANARGCSAAAGLGAESCTDELQQCLALHRNDELALASGQRAAARAHAR